MGQRIVLLPVTGNRLIVSLHSFVSTDHVPVPVPDPALE